MGFAANKDTFVSIYSYIEWWGKAPLNEIYPFTNLDTFYWSCFCWNLQNVHLKKLRGLLPIIVYLPIHSTWKKSPVEKLICEHYARLCSVLPAWNMQNVILFPARDFKRKLDSPHIINWKRSTWINNNLIITLTNLFGIHCAKNKNMINLFHVII